MEILQVQAEQRRCGSRSDDGMGEPVAALVAGFFDEDAGLGRLGECPGDIRHDGGELT